MNSNWSCWWAFAVVVLLLAAPSGAGQSELVWVDVEAGAVATESTGRRLIVPRSFRTLALDWPALEGLLRDAPIENAGEPIEIALPRPDGGFARFAVVESPIMAPGLAAKFPELRTWRGQGIDDPAATLRFDHTPTGLHAQVLTPNGAYFLDPYARDDAVHHISYFRRDLDNPHAGEFKCEFQHDEEWSDDLPLKALETASGDTLRTYRLAVAANGEYTQFHGGTVPLGMAAIVTAMNRINGVYERDVAIRMELVANNDQIVYTNPATDPYSNGGNWHSENQANVDAVIGSANYDLGHLFMAQNVGGAVAFAGVACRNPSKARAFTGLSNPAGDTFYIDFVSHEMGHQWGATHTWNSSANGCPLSQWTASTAFEPGSGSTIMGYAGLCSPHNIQIFSDDYFHAGSYDQIVAYSTVGFGNCDVPSATGNDPPVPHAGADYVIPLDTPFQLCGSATDPDGDELTYCWEQMDTGPRGPPNSPVGNAPIFRSWDPADEPGRYFPRLQDILDGSTVLGELLPTYARTLHFRLTVRDNRSGGGGVDFDENIVDVSNVGGPFEVTSPNTSITWTPGTVETVTWNVANTNLAPISCSHVDVYLSLDSGSTYPVGLVAHTPNDGSVQLTVPDLDVTNDARVRVQCSGNIFFDVSDDDFTISGSGELIFGTTWEECTDEEIWSAIVP